MPVPGLSFPRPTFVKVTTNKSKILYEWSLKNNYYYGIPFFFFSCLLWRAFIEFHIGKWAQCCLLKTCGITVPINLLTEGRAWGSGRFRQLGSSGVSQRSAPWRGAGQGQGGKQRKNLKQNFSLVMVSLHLKFCVYKLEFREIRLLLHISKI